MQDTTRADESVFLTIAGGGVVGITLALLLARRGVASVVLEQRLQPHTLPRAHAVNPRTIEILAGLGISVEELCAVAAPKDLTSEVRFALTMTDYCFGTLPYERQDDDVLAVTPAALLNIPQPALEQILFERAAADPLIDLRRGHQWIAAEQYADEVRSTVGRAEDSYRISSRYLVGADGAGSPVRESLGVTMTGVAEVSAAVSIAFRADLAELTRPRPGVLHWLFGAERMGTLLAYMPDRLWSYTVTMPPGIVDMAEFSEDRVQELIRSALGSQARDVPIELIAVTPWTMRAEVASRYRDGNILLAGDAAHRFPPTGGLGLNTGIQDAHNLAWKLAAVADGWADDVLLDSYDAERRPVAERNARQSLDNLQALGALEILVRAAALGPGTAEFEQFVGDPDHAAQIAAAIEAQRPHFDSLALQLGFSYNPQDAEITEVSDFVPRAAVGRRFPHGWIDAGDGVRPTLQSLDPGAFTIVLFDETADEPPIQDGAPVVTVHFDPHRPDVQHWMSQVGLHGAAAVLVRPDGHILDIAETVGDVKRFSTVIDGFVGCTRTALDA